MIPSHVDRVRAGAQWLDEHQPGWRDRVSINDFNIMDACKCVLGQVFEGDARAAGVTIAHGLFLDDDNPAGFWYIVQPRDGLHHVPRDLPSQVFSPEEAMELGFDARDDDYMDYGKLTYLWKQVIKSVPLDELEELRV